MPLYDKPVRLLFKDMVDDLGIGPGDILTRSQALSWFHEKYPKVKDGTIAAHLLKVSTNSPTRVHYKAKPQGDDDLLFQLDSQRFRLYDPGEDPQPIYSNRDAEGRKRPAVAGEEEDEPQPGGEFAYERDLQHFLGRNLHLLEPGMRLYEEEDVTGIEFPVGSRRVDILALDRDDNYVVIELKVSRGYDRVTGQLLRYMAWIRKHQADAGQQVRGIVVAREASEDLVLACSEVSKVDLFAYELSVTLRKVDTEL